MVNSILDVFLALHEMLIHCEGTYYSLGLRDFLWNDCFLAEASQDKLRRTHHV